MKIGAEIVRKQSNGDPNAHLPRLVPYVEVWTENRRDVFALRQIAEEFRKKSPVLAGSRREPTGGQSPILVRKSCLVASGLWKFEANK